MFKILRIFCTILVCSGAVFAQATAGSGAVSGTIRDAYGDGIPDTTVAISNQALGFQQSVITTDDGVFHSPVLPPGAGYVIRASRPGFVDWQSQPFTVAIGETTRFRIDLQADSTANRVNTKGSGEIENHQMNLELPVDEHQINSLPLSQRKLDPLVGQAPTVSGDAIQGQSLAKETLTDGIQTSSGYFTRPVATTNPVSLDAVSALQVVTADTPAQYRDGMTGIVNAATHSGTTGFHGTAYEYVRLPGLTADGRYSPGQSLLHGKNQTGASLGGPILRDKLLFFANFDIVNDHFDGLNRITSPYLTDSSNCKATAAQCATALKYIQAQMNVLTPLSARSLNGIAKLDYQLNSMNRISLEAAVANALAPNGAQVANAIANGGLLGIRNTRDDSRLVKASWVSTPSSSAVNELRLGLAQNHLFDPSSGSGVGISLAGANIGNSNPSSSLLSERRYQAVDNYTISSAAHTFQLGFDMSWTRFYMNQLANAGEYDYESLTNFATDLPVTTGKNYTYFTQSFGNAIRQFPARQMGIFAQDNWRVSQKLTVNFGLRWEKPMNPQPSQYNTAYYQTDAIASPNLDLAPRVGAAYRLNEKTTIRAGFGFYFAPFSGQLLDALYVGNNVYQQSIAINANQTNSPAFPKVLSASAIPGGAGEVMYSSSKLRNPHTQQTSVSIDRELPWGSTLTASYISSRGYKLWTATDVNLAAATKTGTYTIDDASGNKVSTFTIPIFTARNDTNYSHIYDVENGGGSHYDALAVQLRKKMTHGVTVQASYTWSHAIDDSIGSLIAGGIPVISSVVGETSNRASSNIDQRQRLSFNTVWQPTFTTGNSLFARYFVNGWQLSTLATLASGLPETATVVTTGQQLSGIVPMFGNTLDGSGAWARVPFLPINSLRTGSQYDWNARITRMIPITERIKGSVMFEVFNLLNSQWDTSVNTLAYSATSGVLKPVAGTGTGNAAVSYPYATNARNCQIAFRVTF